MNCPKCGAQVDNDSKFCDVCGAKIENYAGSVVKKDVEDIAEKDPASAVEFETKEPAKSRESLVHKNSAVQNEAVVKPVSNDKIKKIDRGYLKDPFRIIGLIVGTVFIVAGFLRVSDAGVPVSSASFGGDFYTYTYQGIVAIARELAELEKALGWLIAAVGAAIDIRMLIR